MCTVVVACLLLPIWLERWHIDQNYLTSVALGMGALFGARDPADLIRVGGSDSGVSGWGRGLVKEMNRAGTVADGSHCSIRTGLDMCEVSEKPGPARTQDPHASCQQGPPCQVSG